MPGGHINAQDLASVFVKKRWASKIYEVLNISIPSVFHCPGPIQGCGRDNGKMRSVSSQGTWHLVCFKFLLFTLLMRDGTCTIYHHSTFIITYGTGIYLHCHNSLVVHTVPQSATENCTICCVFSPGTLWVDKLQVKVKGFISCCSISYYRWTQRDTCFFFTLLNTSNLNFPSRTPEGLWSVWFNKTDWTSLSK